MISVDLIPEALHKLEFAIRTITESKAKNLKELELLRYKDDAYRDRLRELENDKFRLLTGRNI